MTHYTTRGPSEPGFSHDTALSMLHLPQRVSRELWLEEEARNQAEADTAQAFKMDRFVPSTPAVGAKDVAPSSATPLRRPRGQARLFDANHAELLFEAAKAGRGAFERADLMKKLSKRLLERGSFRRIAKPAGDFFQSLDEIRRRFPNAGDVVDYLRTQAALSKQTGKQVSFSPVCVVGPPGAGKSVLVEAIAEALGAPMHRLQVEIANHASALIGTETHWSSAAPGQLYDLLVEGDYINPIVMLDELEKVQTRSDHPNLHKVLFALLERASAKQFKDACVPQVPLDASWVRWVATANSLDGIPEPILTRMRIIEMPALTAEQACVVARNIDAEIRAQHRLMGLPALPQEAIELLARHSPRRMGQLIAETYGRLLADNRQSLSKADLHALEVAQHKPVSKSNFLSQLLDLTTVAAIRAVELNAQLPRMMVVTGSAPTFH